DTDDFRWRAIILAFRHLKALPDRGAGTEYRLRHRFVDDRHLDRTGHVARVEISTGDQRCSHRCEVAIAYFVQPNHAILARSRGESVSLDGVVPPGTAYGSEHRYASESHPRNGTQPI